MDAIGEGSLAEYLEEVGGLTDYLHELEDWCRKELEKAKQFEQITKLTGTVIDQLQVPWEKLETFIKYQASLDNQTYKAMKALREAQEWRLQTIEGQPETSSEAA